MNDVIQWTRVEDREMARQSENVLRILNEHGYEAYWVGGCVRDELLGRSVDDMDITTSAAPEQVMELFPDCIPTGLQHGTVTVRSGRCFFEVTTFRTESEYKDSRRPSAVQFVKDVKEDLQRRDFTMNALAMGRTGEVVDPFGGQDDIRRRLIRCVGAPNERFGEDALRMLRCVRFSSVFHFRIAYNTWKALVLQRELLQHIAMERVRTEMVKMMAGPHPLRGLELLFRSKVLEHVKAPVSAERFSRKLLGELGKLADEHAILRWSLLLLSGSYTSEEADVLLRKWTFSNEDRARITGVLRVEDHVQNLIKGHHDDSGLRSEWITGVLSYGDRATRDWLQIQPLLPERWRNETEDANARLRVLHAHGAEWSDSMQVHALKDLDITGEHVLRLLDRKGGPWLGQLMKHLLKEAAIGNIANQQEALVAEVKRVSKLDQT